MVVDVNKCIEYGLIIRHRKVCKICRVRLIGEAGNSILDQFCEVKRLLNT